MNQQEINKFIKDNCALSPDHRKVVDNISFRRAGANSSCEFYLGTKDGKLWLHIEDWSPVWNDETNSIDYDAPPTCWTRQVKDPDRLYLGNRN